MRKDDSTGASPARPRYETSRHEPIRQWSTLPITQQRAEELVDLITRREDSDSLDALIALICGLTPHTPSDDKHILDERFLAGQAALMHAFTGTRRAANDLGAYVVRLGLRRVGMARVKVRPATRQIYRRGAGAPRNSPSVLKSSSTSSQ